MFLSLSNKHAMMHLVAQAAERLCVGYWAVFSTKTIEQDPNKMASFSEGSGYA